MPIKTGPFANWILYNHLKPAIVWYSGGLFIINTPNQIQMLPTPILDTINVEPICQTYYMEAINNAA